MVENETIAKVQEEFNPSENIELEEEINFLKLKKRLENRVETSGKDVSDSRKIGEKNGFEMGYEEGKEHGKLLMAKRLLNEYILIEQIAEETKLDESKIINILLEMTLKKLERYGEEMGIIVNGEIPIC